MKIVLVSQMVMEKGRQNMPFIRFYSHTNVGDTTLVNIKEVREFLPGSCKDLEICDDSHSLCLEIPEGVTWLEMLPAYILPLQRAGWSTDENLSPDEEAQLRQKYPSLFE